MGLRDARINIGTAAAMQQVPMPVMIIFFNLPSFKASDMRWNLCLRKIKRFT